MNLRIDSRKIRGTLACLSMFLCTFVASADWPTHNHDIYRSGMAESELQFPMTLQWQQQAVHAPRPAWPRVAFFDYWHRHDLQNFQQFYDHACGIIAVDDKVYCNSPTDDRVVCLDRKSGKELWDFFADAPVRLAPTYHEQKILFGSDDGRVYCLNAATGKLLWKSSLKPRGQLLPGNGRLMSLQCVRSDVFCNEGVGYFCSGLFSLSAMGTHYANLDLETGEIIDSAPLGQSGQGYLFAQKPSKATAEAEDEVRITRGRVFRRSEFVAKLKRRGDVPSAEPLDIEGFRYGFVGTPSVRIAGGDGEVAAFDLKGQRLWAASVEGIAHNLAISDGQLLVSTSAGEIYCFGATKVSSPKIWKHVAQDPYAAQSDARSVEDTSKRIINEAQADQGYCLVLGSGNGHLVAALARNSRLHVVGVESDPKQVALSRKMLSAAGLYGVRTSILHVAPDEPLPYVEKMFNLIVDGALANSAMPPHQGEIQRLLKPATGVAILKDFKSQQGGAYEADSEWSSLYADLGNTCSTTQTFPEDRFAIQWFGEPGTWDMVDRHHRAMSGLYKDGRMFAIGENKIIGVDAFNGTILWRQDVPGSMRHGLMRDCGPVVVDDSNIYAAANDTCVAFSVSDGKLTRRYWLPKGFRSAKVEPVKVAPQRGKPASASEALAPASEVKAEVTLSKKMEWGYVAATENTLVGSAQIHGASLHKYGIRGGTPETPGHGNPPPFSTMEHDWRKVVVSKALFGLDLATGKTNWVYRQGAIMNSSLAIGQGCIFFLESQAPGVVADDTGRVPIAVPYGRTGVTKDNAFNTAAQLVCLDVKTGKLVWKRDFDLPKQQVVHLCYRGGMGYISGSTNLPVEGAVIGRKVQQERRYEIFAFDAKSGKDRWKASLPATKPGGSHGEQWQHPVFAGNLIVLQGQPAVDATTGEIQDINFRRKGCGNAVGCGSHVFTSRRLAAINVKTQKTIEINGDMRTGCWVNILPAGGLLLAPESGTGCHCGNPIRTSIVYRPGK